MDTPLPEPTTIHRFPLRNRILCACLVTLLGLCMSFDASAAGQGSVRYSELAQPTRLHAGDAVIGALPMGQPIHVEVALKLRDRAGLDALLAGHAQQPMSRENFLDDHAPTQAQAQAVADYLTRMGYRNVTIAPNRLLVSADGTAMTARNAFTTTFAQVRTHDGRIAYANTDAVRIPGELGDTVAAVLGLQNVHMAHTLVMMPTAGSLKTQTTGGFQPSAFTALYKATGYAPAATVPVGLITYGFLNPTKADLNAYTTAKNLRAVTMTTVNTNGTSTDTSGTAEWDLDTQSMLGMAGGQIGKLIFYNVPDRSNANLVADFNAAVVANQTKIISVSMAECETDAGPSGDNSAAAADAIFANAMAQGQTFAIANGDTGADECGDGGTTPSWPADSPYVVAIAGTTTTGPTIDYQVVVWNTLGQPGGGATGGSESSFEPGASWHNKFAVKGWPGPNRGVADFALDADPNTGALVIVNGAQQQLGGTGLAASIFAGFWARFLQGNNSNFAGLTWVGFAGNFLYCVGFLRFDSEVRDIGLGNNGGFQAVAGYDLASGLGSPNFDGTWSSATAWNDNCPHVSPIAAFDYTPNGLGASFADQSVTYDGASIVKHAWHFGDGTASTATTPTHTYAAAGRYWVTEDVTDGFGLPASVKIPVTVSTSVPMQLFTDTGFEDNSYTSWQFKGRFEGAGAKCNSSIYLPHTGQCLAALDFNDSYPNGYVQRLIGIPGGMSKATLAFSLRVLAEYPNETNADKMRVVVRNPAGVYLQTLRNYSNSDAGTNYVTRSMDLSKYIGQAVIVQFQYEYTQDSIDTFEIDDVTLKVQ